MPSDQITAVVPVWNRRDLVAPLLAGLRPQTLPPVEVIVVDNGSTDGAADAAADAGACVLRMGANLGFAAAVNRGIRAARSAWIAVVNNDVELAPDYFQVLLRAAQETGAWYATGKLFAAARDGVLDGAWDVLSRGGTAWRCGHGERDGPAFACGRAIFSAPWTAALFRAALFDRAGLLDESLVSYLEDVEFGIRCVLSHSPGVFVPEAVAWHRGSATLGSWHPETVRLMARNQLLVVARYFAPQWAWHALVAQSLWGLVALRHGAGRAWLRGKWEALRELRNVRGTFRPETAKTLEPWLAENEQFVRAAPHHYWRLYSLLTSGGAK